MNNQTIYVTGEARTTIDNAITKMFGTFYIAFEVILSTDEIIDMDCNATLRLTRDFIKRLFLNHNIIKDEEILKKEIATRYFGSSSKAILTAYHDALQHYKKIKDDLKEKRWNMNSKTLIRVILVLVVIVIGFYLLNLSRLTPYEC